MQLTRSTRRSEIKDEDFSPTELDDGSVNLPKMGERCLFLLRAWPRPDGRVVHRGFRAFGYREDTEVVYLPYHRAHVPTVCVKGWVRVSGPLYHDGHL